MDDVGESILARACGSHAAYLDALAAIRKRKEEDRAYYAAANQPAVDLAAVHPDDGQGDGQTAARSILIAEWRRVKQLLAALELQAGRRVFEGLAAADLEELARAMLDASELFAPIIKHLASSRRRSPISERNES